MKNKLSNLRKEYSVNANLPERKKTINVLILVAAPLDESDHVDVILEELSTTLVPEIVCVSYFSP